MVGGYIDGWDRFLGGWPQWLARGARGGVQPSVLEREAQMATKADVLGLLEARDR